MNTSIFKANFEVIVQIIMNNIWDKVTEQFLVTLINIFLY